MNDMLSSNMLIIIALLLSVSAIAFLTLALAIRNLLKSKFLKLKRKRESINLFEQWLKNHPSADEKRYIFRGEKLSAKGMVEAAKIGTELDRLIIKSVVDVTDKSYDLSRFVEK